VDDNGTSQAAPKLKWYQTTSALVIGLLAVGPLALPLLWINPRFSALQKVFWTVVVLVLTWAMVVFTADIGQKVIDQYRQLGLIK
jgi:hypothetical protein